MGIRFFCPNGHKLNVKEFQAGWQGLCPACNAKLLVPLESTRLSSKLGRRTTQEGASVDLNVNATPPPPVLPASAPAAVADPLAEGKEIVWYVRPPSGGQFGLATPHIMREWLAEGRIGSESLVWREGWRDWKTAVDVFPQFASSPPVVGVSCGDSRQFKLDLSP
jgi:hypothetical protein